MSHRERSKPLGIDPHLVVLFDLDDPLAAEDFRAAGLTVVDTADTRVVIAFADDPELASFYERLDKLEGGIPEGQKNEPYANFFDAIRDMRSLGPDDRITPGLRDALRRAAPDEILRLDVECWHPGEPNRARDWLQEVRSAVAAADGQFVDGMANDGIGLLMARVYVPAARVREPAELDVLARLDVLPTPVLSVPELFDTDLEDVPEVLPPGGSAPVVGIVDSGVASAHELLAGSVVASEAIGTGIENDQDEHGHGTMVASLVLHGDIPAAVRRRSPIRPLCAIASARVLDERSLFPEAALWERDLSAAIEWCAAQGASIINLSIGDDRSPFTTAHQLTAAAVVDDLARRLGLVVVVATGNSHPLDYLDHDDEHALDTYPAALLRSDRARLIDPATSLLALTVGGMTTEAAAGGMSGSESVRRTPVGRAGWPSPITRVGPGPGAAVKPELVYRSGTLGLEDGRLVSNDAELGVIGARAAAGRLLAWDVGTSFAAPMVARMAAAVKARFPEFSPELVRSLVLASAERDPVALELEGRPAEVADAERRLVGYGVPSLARACESTSHRVLLIAEDAVPVDGVHVYEVPTPTSFLESGGRRGVDVALAYSPRTRVRRLDYLATRMEFHLTKGLSLDEVIEAFAQIEGEDLEDERTDAGGDDPELKEEATAEAGAQQAPDGGPPTLSDLRSHLIKLDISTAARSRGANQLGRKAFAQRLQQERDMPMFLVVRNINRWADPTADEPYALTIALWRDEDHSELHAELETQLEAVVELPIEVPIEI